MPSAYELFMRTAKLGLAARYAASTILVALAVLARWLLTPWMPSGDDYLLFEFAVALSAMFFDHGSSFWATGLSALAVVYLFVPPEFSLALAPGELAPLVTFVFTCVVLSLAAEILRQLAEDLTLSNKEREVLYDELQHRSRNNMQIIGTSIALQMIKTKDPELRAALERVAERIASVARLDSLLHRPGTGEHLDICAYLEALTQDIGTSLAGQRPVTLACDAEPWTVEREMASTIGITVNELVTNALKHAFPGGVAGHVGIALKVEGEEYVLTVEDNGRGCAGGAANGTGWRLIASLIARHRGRFEIDDAEPGCRVTVRFPRSGALPNAA